MKSSLGELAYELQQNELQRWFREFLSDVELLERSKQDSWELHEAVLFLWAKPLPQISEQSIHNNDFWITCWGQAHFFSLNSKSEQEEDRIWCIAEGIKRLDKFYQLAVRAIEGDILPANAMTVIRDGNSFIRYHVKPNEFLLWANKRQLLCLPKVDRFIQNHILPKKPGRHKDARKHQLISFLVEISNRPECKDKTSKEVLKLPDAQPTIEKLLQGLKGETRRTKLNRIERDLREHLEFGGIKKNTGPSRKKGVKS